MELTKQNYVEVISNLSNEEKISFYEFLAHNLTVSCRSIWSNEALSKNEIIESMKWLNEILHRITAKLRVERLESHEWKEEDIIKMMSEYVKQCSHLDSEIAWAIKSSYETLINQKNSN
jgi:hypothetical protein